jgi:hypothetical protein
MLGERIGNLTVGFLIAAMIAQSVSLYSGFILAISLSDRLAVPLVTQPPS